MMPYAAVAPAPAQLPTSGAAPIGFNGPHRRTSPGALAALLDDVLGDAEDLSHVFARVSAIAQRALPHDAVALLVSPVDGRETRVHASCGFLDGVADAEHVLPALVDTHDSHATVVHADLSAESGASARRLAGLGFQSLLRLPVHISALAGGHASQRAGGALVFLSASQDAFTPDDQEVGGCIAERLAAALARDSEIRAAYARADEALARAARLDARVRTLTEEIDPRTGLRYAIGGSPAWRRVLTQATQVASTDTTVLLLGQSGTGKEVVARYLHRASSRRRGPFIALNCAALPEQLLEAELFGYERGAYTGAMQSKPGQLELAAGGTLFLDEVGEMSPAAQAKFLRVLQEREFQRLGGTRTLRADVRIVAATNRDLPRAIANGTFREDLYYRLNVFAIRLPPLCERRDDVLPLSMAFLAEFGRVSGRPLIGISREARKRLLAYHWPGNVRELRNVLERAAILCDGGLVTSEHLAIDLQPPVTAATGAAAGTAPTRPGTAAAAAGREGAPQMSATDLPGMERAMIEQVLHEVRFNKTRAAHALGLTRRQLYSRLRKYGFE
jgi:transcriptional regulator with GAF, ATPase, and Fis domain